MRPLRILTLAFLLFTLTAAAQTDRRIEEQKRVIAALEKRIATEEQEISKIQKGRTAPGPPDRLAQPAARRDREAGAPPA